ncbi:hypothetical protein HK100_002328 [Physocladia obscura]|uniref:prolyl oligopeptidase n=1 Tax=Physocladia obscura TaxID=109957 RepID=A0AAD5XK13_9FUNG|nr:hypothetical protein HK100_002328 [Physocladia obscura]
MLTSYLIILFRYGTPFKKGDNYYYFYNSGLQPQSVLYTQKTIDGEASVFFDPNTLSADGTISLGTYSFSESGNLFGYALSESGSDWVKIHVRKVGDDKDLEEKPLEWAKFTGIEFTHDEKGFFYTRFAAPSVNHDKAGTETDKAKNQLLCYHRIGTSQDQDIIVYNDDANPERMFWIQVSDCGRYLILAIRRSTEPKNLVYFADLEKQFGSNSVLDVPEFTEIIGEWSAGYSFIGNVGNVFYFETSFDAPKKRIVKYVLPTKVILTKTTTTKTVTVKNGNSTKTTKTESVSELIEPVKAVFEEVIGEADTAIDFLRIVDIDKLILVYLKDVKHVVKVYNLKTGAFLNDIAIPEGSIINGISGSKKSPELFYSYSSYIAPTTIRRYEFAADSSDTLFKQVVVPGISTDIFEVKQVFYTSEDGTKIPMYIFYKKGTVLDGENPTLLYAYGGFSISILPSFNIQYLTFIEKFNGVVAVANIRGGGEYGKAWHDAGKLFNKQNCYTDFQYAARYLISEKYTKPAKLTINGGSNGGLLIGTCLNQTPELFGLGIAEVGVMDLLRFHKFTIGGAWVADFGNPDVKEEFENAKKISPLHNVDGSKTYPAVLLTTGDHDDRVVPLHSMKLAATLQHELNENPNPIMMRVNTKAGHGAGKSIQQTIEEAADKYTFLSIVLNAPYMETTCLIDQIAQLRLQYGNITAKQLHEYLTDNGNTFSLARVKKAVAKLNKASLENNDADGENGVAFHMEIPDPNKLWATALSLQANSNTDEALEAAAQAFLAFPDIISVSEELMLEGAKEARDSIFSVTRVLGTAYDDEQKNEQNTHRAFVILAGLCIRNKDFKNALTLSRKAIDSLTSLDDKKNRWTSPAVSYNDRLAALHTFTGTLLLELSFFKDSLITFEKSVELDPSSVRARQYKCIAAFKATRFAGIAADATVLKSQAAVVGVSKYLVGPCLAAAMASFMRAKIEEGNAWMEDAQKFAKIFKYYGPDVRMWDMALETQAMFNLKAELANKTNE